MMSFVSSKRSLDITMTSTGYCTSPSARRILTLLSRVLAGSGSTTSRSMSLSLVIWPVTADPNRMILSGLATARTRRTTSVSNISSTPIRFHHTQSRPGLHSDPLSQVGSAPYCFTVSVIGGAAAPPADATTGASSAADGPAAVTFSVIGGLATVPTVTTTGCGPRGASAGTLKSIWVRPATPLGMPAKSTVAASPPTVTAMGKRACGSFVGSVMVDAGVAPVASDGVTSPSPVINSSSNWPCGAEVTALPVELSMADAYRPGAAATTVNANDAICPLLLTASTAVPAPVS